MLVGMGTVFVFLTVLVVGMSMMSVISMKLTSSSSGDDASEEQVAAITAAISQHRKKTAK